MSSRSRGSLADIADGSLIRLLLESMSASADTARHPRRGPFDAANKVLLDRMEP